MKVKPAVPNFCLPLLRHEIKIVRYNAKYKKKEKKKNHLAVKGFISIVRTCLARALNVTDVI